MKFDEIKTLTTRCRRDLTRRRSNHLCPYPRKHSPWKGHSIWDRRKHLLGAVLLGSWKCCLCFPMDIFFRLCLAHSAAIRTFAAVFSRKKHSTLLLPSARPRSLANLQSLSERNKNCCQPRHLYSQSSRRDIDVCLVECSWIGLSTCENPRA